MWARLPLAIRALLVGACVFGSANVVWSVLVLTNLRYQPRVPWSVPATAVCLWLYWRYLRGDGPPQRTAEARKEYLRGRALTARVWRWSLAAGGMAVAALWALYFALGRFLPIPRDHSDAKAYSVLTVVVVILMNAAVAAVSEEAGFRGYMQVPLEARHGPVVAIGLVSVAFALAHLAHGWQAVVLAPLYVVVGVIYGSLAYLTGSILPALVLHFVGDVVLFSLRYWRSGLRAPVAPLGAHVSWPPLVAAMVCAGLAAYSFHVLARIRGGSKRRVSSASPARG